MLRKLGTVIRFKIRSWLRRITCKFKYKMETTEEDVNTQKLNFIFKPLGERGEEGEVWKEYTEHVTGYLLQQLSEYFSKTYENCMILRAYGSAVEDLKSLAWNDVGDLDIMITPKSDDLMIYEEMIEYSENPMHVRIKGIDHPVLQSCLVGDTEYVATSALKNFHSAIYGKSAPHMVDVLTRLLQIASREEWSKIDAQWKNNKASPALQLNCSQFWGTISEEVERMKNLQTLTNLDPEEWEWLAHFFCKSRGSEYTTEHAKILDEYVTFVKEVQMSFCEKGLLCQQKMFPSLLQEIVFSDRAQNFRARIHDIESRSQNESSRRRNCLTEAAWHFDDQCVTPENHHAHATEKDVSEKTLPSRDESPVKPENGDGKQRSVKALLPTASQSASEDLSKKLYPSLEKSMTEMLQQATELVDNGNAKCEQREDPHESQNESNAEEPVEWKGNVFLRDFQGNPEDEHEDFESLSGQTNSMFEHLFRTITEEDKDPSKRPKLKDTQKAPILGGIDLVPAFRSQGWPMVARDWIERDRKWPSPDVVQKVVHEGFHLVVKPPKNSGNPDCYFRISFSHAEYLLSQEMNDIQRECYRCLKKYHGIFLSKEPKGLVNFHLKNIFLQTIEETGADMWIESNRAKCMMKLLGNLLLALATKDLRHFFVRSYNLFSIDYIESPKILETLAEKVQEIVENPMHFATLIKKEEAENQVEKKNGVPSSEPNSASGQGYGEVEETAPMAYGSDVGQTKHGMLAGVAEKAATLTHQGTSSNTSYRFHDLKEIYLTTSQELTNMAFNDADISLEALDPLERSLVEDLREMMRKHNIHVEQFRKMFESFWDTIYLKVWINPESKMRHRMLEAIQGVVKTMKYLLRQDNLALENVEAMSERILDPNVEDRFDLNNLWPAGVGTQIIGRYFNSLESRPVRPPQVNMDDIPLD